MLFRSYKLAMEVGVVSDEILATLCQGIDKAEDVDMKAAGQLITQRLAPLVASASKTVVPGCALTH